MNSGLLAWGVRAWVRVVRSVPCFPRALVQWLGGNKNHLVDSGACPRCRYVGLQVTWVSGVWHGSQEHELCWCGHDRGVNGCPREIGHSDAYAEV